jgi:uncharacterized protein (TIGR02172 family)
VKGKLIAQGRTAEIYEWGDKNILKLFREQALPSTVEYEYKISSIVQGFGLAVPKVLEMVYIEKRLGIIYEKIDGITMLKEFISRPLKVTGPAGKMADLHYSIHKCEEDNLPSQKEIIKRSIERAELLTDNKRKQILEYLDKLPDGKTLCHGDFHPDNILFSDGKAVVIDWITASMGIAAADVARTSLLIRIGSMPPGTSFIVKNIVKYLRAEMNKKYLDRYLKISGMDMEEVEKWELPIAAARLVEWVPNSEKRALLQIVDNGLVRIYKNRLSSKKGK